MSNMASEKTPSVTMDHANYDNGVAPPPMMQQQQPMASAAMSMGMAADPLNPKGLPKNEAGERSFNHGLIDAMSVDTGFCLFACCLPCMTYGSNKGKYDALKNTNAPPHDDGYVGGNCFTFCLAQCVYAGCILDMFMRTEMRQRAGIQGSTGDDFLASWCCLPCNHTQMHLELQAEEEARRGVNRV